MLPHPGIYRTQRPVSASTLPAHGQFILYSEGQNGTEAVVGNAKANRLEKLRQAVEEQIPQFLEKSFFEFPSDLVDNNTVLYVERRNGSVHKIRSQTYLSLSITAVRLYYYSRSSYRRVELLSILSDVDKGQLDVSFRIVLLPSPSLRDSRLPRELLARKLEQRAKWHEFRATFYVSDSGEINKIRITRSYLVEVVYLLQLNVLVAF
ncbi:unnamed protein product [Echinostoma caproni]|uniref:Uncharacterized protein n=1 Tax=Echinostoma caproni TaxID=27848 RepID=A0A183ATY2_9TREM|nr:unnamed protein product [Echinostoma caproni]